MKRAISSAISWRAIQFELACTGYEPFDGRSRLMRRDNDMAVARWDGERFVFPATSGMPLDFEPTEYQP